MSLQYLHVFVRNVLRVFALGSLRPLYENQYDVKVLRLVAYSVFAYLPGMVLYGL